MRPLKAARELIVVVIFSINFQKSMEKERKNRHWAGMASLKGKIEKLNIKIYSLLS